jgi:peptide/nickel transport system permease protein
VLRLVGQRVVAIIPLLVVATAATFLLLQLSDVDPAKARLGDSATEEQYATVRAELGTDRPVVEQYARWLGDAVQLDFGTSWQRPIEVTELVRQRLPATLSLTFGALVVALVIGVPTGIAAGVRAGSATDVALSGVASVGQAIPNFWAALMLAAFIGVPYDVFPATGFVGPTTSVVDWLRSITLPSIALGTASAAAIARQTRAAVASAVREPYVRTAIAAGHSRRSVLSRDVLRNASIPIVTVIGIQASLLLGGSLIVEQAFAIPGMGSLAFTAVLQNDVPVVLAIVAVAALLMMTVQLLLDVVYGLLDPRVRPS